MSTHVPGLKTFFRYFASFCTGQISHIRIPVPSYFRRSGGIPRIWRSRSEALTFWFVQILIPSAHLMAGASQESDSSHTLFRVGHRIPSGLPLEVKGFCM